MVVSRDATAEAAAAEAAAGEATAPAAAAFVSVSFWFHFHLFSKLEFGVRSGSVENLFGLRSGRFRTKIFGAKNSKFQKFSICAAVAAAGRLEGPRHGGDGRTN